MQTKTYHTVKYGYTLEQYKAEVGLTFAQNNSNQNIEKENDIQIAKGFNFEVSNDYDLDVILNDKKETIALLKENEKVA